jgi:hypothetical protein
MTRSSKRKEDDVSRVLSVSAPLPKRTKKTKVDPEGQAPPAAIPESHAVSVPEARAVVAVTDATQPLIPKEYASKAAVVTNTYPHAEFNHFFFQLMAFKAEHSNYNVPKDTHPELHTWLQNLKRDYKHYVGNETTSPLTEEQAFVLESLHVPVTSRGDEHWNRFFGLLQQYREEHGHVLVPRLCEVPGLGDWVTDQRRQHKAWKQGQSSQLTKDRREKLESIGFTWQVRNRPEWELRYHELLQYKQIHGDCKVPQHYKENKALGKWVAKQREQFKLMRKGQHSFLTPYRLEKLNEAAFVWQVRTAMDTDDMSNPLTGEAAMLSSPTILTDTQDAIAAMSMPPNTKNENEV